MCRRNGRLDEVRETSVTVKSSKAEVLWRALKSSPTGHLTLTRRGAGEILNSVIWIYLLRSRRGDISTTNSFAAFRNYLDSPFIRLQPTTLQSLDVYRRLGWITETPY